MQRSKPFYSRTIRKRKKTARLRLLLILFFTAFITGGITAIAGALGGMEYGMPLLKGIKQILLGGTALGFGLGGRYALG